MDKSKSGILRQLCSCQDCGHCGHCLRAGKETGRGVLGFHYPSFLSSNTAVVHSVRGGGEGYLKGQVKMLTRTPGSPACTHHQNQCAKGFVQ